MSHLTTRDVPVEIPHTTLLFVDVQNFCALRNGGWNRSIDGSARHAPLPT